MIAITRAKYGGPEVLLEKVLPKLQPGENELLVKNYASTVNRTDCGILTGKPFIIRFFTGLFKPKKKITGTDFAGCVELAGKAVKNFKPGDRIMGFNDMGLCTHAEYIIVDANQPMVIIPESLDFASAAASMEGSHYAYNILKNLNIPAGSKVLVNGATGAIGTSIVQFLKHFKMEITAVCNAKNIELVKRLGSNKVWNWETEDFLNDTDRYHFIIDAVGKSTFTKCKHLLLPGGVYCSTELGPNAENIFLPLITRVKGGKQVKFPVPSDCQRSLEFIKTLLENKEFKPVVDKTYPATAAREAYQYVLSGSKTGNVVLSFNS